jgi:hypothetical protein
VTSSRPPIVVLLGGPSAEHDVSIVSGTAVAEALAETGHEVAQVLIDLEGRWWWLPADHRRAEHPAAAYDDPAALGADGPIAAGAALDRLAEECALAGKDELFKRLNSHLSVTSEGAVPYEEMSFQLGRPITTLRSDVARLRSRYRAILREEVGGTVAQASEVDAELRHLCVVLMAD